MIERFNDTYDNNFFRRQWFSNYAMLKRQSKNFQRFHNKHHRYSCLKGKTPLDVIEAEGFRPLTLGPNTKLPKIDYIPHGNISLIRFIRNDKKLDIYRNRATLAVARRLVAYMLAVDKKHADFKLPPEMQAA